jgi:histidinol dehydrogenase
MRILEGKAALARVRKLSVRRSELAAVEGKVRRIINSVARHGDRALLGYARRWDGLRTGHPLRVPEAEIEQAWKSASPELRSSLQESASNIRRFCEWQKPAEWKRTYAGLSVGQIVRPLDSVGCYVPGGRHPLLSTLLMTVIPAQVAGVRIIRVASPHPQPEVLAAAGMLGIREFYRIGGAHAIAALAYGTPSIPKVTKIVGPGNLYVTAAKKLVSHDCAIDFLAGPTEAVILSSGGRPDFIAADLVAQAEHDPQALAVFITTTRPHADAVRTQLLKLADGNPVAVQSLKAGAMLVAGSRRQAREWANLLAPEHITIEPSDLPFIRNAGSIFVGEYSAQAAGDYASGPNHVLPTAGAACFRGGLSVLDFVKIISVQSLSRRGLKNIAKTVEFLAQTEGLAAHAQSVRLRCADA